MSHVHSHPKKSGGSTCKRREPQNFSHSRLAPNSFSFPNKHKHDDPTANDHPPVFHPISAVNSIFSMSAVRSSSSSSHRQKSQKFNFKSSRGRRGEKKPRLYVSPFVSDPVQVAGVDSDRPATASDELFQIPSRAAARATRRRRFFILRAK